jgi:type IV pilus assembly protein PilV
MLIAMNTLPTTLPPAQRGSTLIEVLVSMLILSIALLGIASLQASSMRFAQGSGARAAVAANLADLADRIRTNPDAADTAYVLTANYATQRTALAAGTVTSAKTCGNAAVTCNAAELAEYDMVQFRKSLNQNMPGAAVQVAGSKTAGYVVSAMWFDKTYLKDELNKTNQLDTAPVCDGTETGISSRSCCPLLTEAPAGVRCTNMTVLP